MTRGALSRGAVTVIGEALIDLVPGDGSLTFVAHPGGSPFNVAVGLARLGARTSLMARLADNAFGRVLRERARAEGINLGSAPYAAEPTTLAVVSLDAEARPSYDFYLEGTADWQWSKAEVDRLPTGTTILHFGSIASWTPPGDVRIAELARRVREAGSVLVSYDPNIRPALLGDRRVGRASVQHCVTLAHVTKASTEDLAWLYPDSTVEEVAQGWLSLGASLVVITDGRFGARSFSASGLRVERPGSDVAVIDTVGAGDSFTAAFLTSLIERDLASPHSLQRCGPQDLSDALDDAILASSLTCGRAGADPPTAADITRTRLGSRLPTPDRE